MALTVKVLKTLDLPRSTTDKEVVDYILSDLKAFFQNTTVRVGRGKGRPKGSKNKEQQELPFKTEEETVDESVEQA